MKQKDVISTVNLLQPVQLNYLIEKFSHKLVQATLKNGLILIDDEKVRVSNKSF